MLDFFRTLFSTDFMPHVYCLREPGLIKLHLFSDGVIALSYALIPIALMLLMRRRRDLVFPWMFTLFGIFILGCGLTHVMGMITLWHPAYRLDGLIKAITAAASFPTALLLFRLLPQVEALPSPGRLQAEISQRQRAEKELREMNEKLERRVAERTAALRRSNEQLEQFAYAAAHDLQEPLRNISNSLGLVRRLHAGQLNTDAVRWIDFSVEGAQRMHDMVKDLLTYSRAVDGLGSPENPVSAHQAVQTALANLTIMIATAGASIDVGPLPSVFVLETHLVQIFQNLVANSVKYRQKDIRPEIRISASRTGPEWQFSVADNGIGFDPQYSDKIFGVFRRLHQRNEYQGNGIGLAICARIVSHYGGRIWAESAAGQGASFHFTLPAREEAG